MKEQVSCCVANSLQTHHANVFFNMVRLVRDMADKLRGVGGQG
jgi:hypothetical protein